MACYCLTISWLRPGMLVLSVAKESLERKMISTNVNL
jgi:hypothetical protein